ncbi:MAG: hypothetical protein R2911_10430 [Caldilineaceae bacterium]
MNPLRLQRTADGRLERNQVVDAVQPSLRWLEGCEALRLQRTVDGRLESNRVVDAVHRSLR